MTRLGRWARRTGEKLLGRFYEGPEAPERLGEMIVWWANAHPQATRLQWVAFAAEHARECYRSGYLRGYEFAERDPEPPQYDPDYLADAMYGRAWRDTPVELEGDPEARVPTEGDDATRLLDQLRRFWPKRGAVEIGR